MKNGKGQMREQKNLREDGRGGECSEAWRRNGELKVRREDDADAKQTKAPVDGGCDALKRCALRAFDPFASFVYLFSSLCFHRRNAYFFLSKISLLNEKMLLIFSCVAFLSVHYYLLTVASALPVTQATALLAEADEKNITAVLVNSSRPGALECRNSSNTTRQVMSDGREEEKEEFQPCKVSNVTYQHKERIPRADPCDMCICVDSEMYCFWKLCTLLNSTNFIPASSPATVNNLETAKQSKNDNKITLSKLSEANVNLNTVEPSDEKFSIILKNQRKYNALKKLEATSAKNLVTEKMKMNLPSSTAEPTICYVMGVMYKYGEVLPRDTGTCLECACSEGGRVTCSPKDCVSQPDLDYLSHNNNLDMFDLDTF